MNQSLLNGSRLYFSEDMAEAEIVPVAGGSACVFSRRCPSKSGSNEDAAAIVPVDDSTAVLIIADGLGGAALGEKASRVATEAIVAAVSDFEEAGGAEAVLRTAILNGIENANAAVRELGNGGATTMAVVEITADTMRPYHVGDSGILVTGGRGKVKLQTIAHSPVSYGVEAGLIDDSQALHHEDRHIVSNVIGMENMRIDIGPPLKFRARDTVLLASDGLFDNLYTEEIVEEIRKGPLTKTANALRDTLARRMAGAESGLPSKPDDTTFIIFRRTSVT